MGCIPWVMDFENLLICFLVITAEGHPLFHLFYFCIS